MFTQPKPVVENRIEYMSMGGIICRLDSLVNQSVNNGSSPTFGNLFVTGNTTISGNLYVEGNTTVIDTTVSEYKTNILLLNDSELGAGVSLLQAGIEIDRGSLTNYQIVYDEITKTFRVGTIGGTQPVCVRENTPLLNGIMTWNSTLGTLISSNTFKISLNIQDTTNSISTTSGSLYTLGGIGISKDLYIGGNIYFDESVITSINGNLSIESENNIILNPGGYISIPTDTALIFGNTNQSMIFNPGSNQWKIQSGANIVYEFVNGINHYISIPNQVPITFSTLNEKIYTDSSNNMVVAGSQDIQLNPGPTNKILIPVNTPLAFYNVNQQISGDANGDLFIQASNNILLNLTGNGYIRIPTDNALKFGGGGNQSIIADDNNNLNINSENTINITSQSLNLSKITLLTWQNIGNQSIISSDYTNGNLLLGTNGSTGSIVITNTQDSTNSTNGSLIVDGGLNVSKNIFANANVLINNTIGGLSVISNNTQIFDVDLSQIYGQIRVKSGDGTNNNKGFMIQSNSNISKNLIQLNTVNDTVNSYYIGRDTLLNNYRNFNINIPSFINDYYSSGTIPLFSISTNDTNNTLFSVESDTGNVNIYGSLIIHSTQDSISTTTGSFILHGGLGINKNLNVGGTITCTGNNTQAVLIGDGNLIIDTINNNLELNGNVYINNNITINNLNSSIITDSIIYITNTTSSFNDTFASLIVSGGININGNLNVENTSYFGSNLNMGGNNILNVNMPINGSDAANKSYVDLIKQGLFVKDSVQVATLFPQNLSLDFISGNQIDGYTLNIGDRILIKNQINSIENGIYIIQNTGNPIRSIDFNTGMNASGSFVFVEKGNYNNNSGWICNTITDDIIGTNGINFTQFTGAGELIDGIAISIDTNVINVNIDGFSIEIDSNNNLRLSSIGISTGLVGGSGTLLETDTNQSHVTQLGSIVSGEWNATNIGVPYGGTGRTLFNQGNILYGNNSGAINTYNGFTFDDNNILLGVGTNVPTQNIHISSLNNSIILLDADTQSINSNAYPSIQFNHTNLNQGSISIVRNSNNLYNNTLSDSIVIGNNNTSGSLTSGSIQFATNNNVNMTILQNGYIGVNTNNPQSLFTINGNLECSSLNSSSVYIDSSLGNSITATGNVYLNNTIISNLTLGNLLTNNLDTDTIISNNIIANNNLTVSGNSILNNFIFTSTNGSSYIYTPILNSNGSFINETMQPINIGPYNSNNYIATFNSTGVLINSLQIGNFILSNNDNNNLFINPFNENTIGNYCNLLIFSENSFIQYSNDTFINNNNNINIIGSSYSNINISPNFVVTSLNTSGSIHLQLPLYLSNTSGNNIISYIPSSSNGTLLINNDINTIINGNISLNSNFYTLNNGSLLSLNNTTEYPNWNYLGILPNSTNITLTCHSNCLKLDFFINISGGDITVSHDVKGNSLDYGFPIIFDIYQDTSNIYKLFAYVPSNTISTISIINGLENLQIINEGTDSIPNGYISGFEDNWKIIYSTIVASDTENSFGTVYINNNLNISTNIPIINYQSNLGSVDTGIAAQRYIGDIINDNVYATFTLPSQTTMNINSLKISNASLINNFYNGFYVKCNLQILQVISYNPVLQVVVLNGNWNTQPSINDIAYFYSNTFFIQAYNESTRQLSIGYTNTVSSNNIEFTDYANLQAWNINANIISSLVVSTNSLILSGGTGSISAGTILSSSLSVNDDGSSPLNLLHVKSVHNSSANIRIEGPESIISFVNVYDTSINSDIVFNSSGTLNITEYFSINNNQISCLSPLYINNIISNYSNNILGFNNDFSSFILDTSGNINLSLQKSFNINSLFNISSNGSVIISNTDISSISNASLYTYGGITINCTANALDYNNGGSLSVQGGISSAKDMYIGGNIYLNGYINAPNIIQNISNINVITSGSCTVNYINNIVSETISSRINLTFYVSLNIDNSGDECSFILQIPNITQNFINRADINIQVSGWVENTNDVTPLFNTIGVGIIGTTNALFKFQSVSLDIHYLQIQCYYFSN